MLNRILIDPQAFTQQKQSMQGKVALSDLDKRVHSPDFTQLSAQVAYFLAGDVDKWQHPGLSLTLSGSLPMRCQRCMQPVNVQLNEHAQIVLFDNENELNQAMLVDEACEGVLIEPELDVFTLLEDQILMALPFSPKHEHCHIAHEDAIHTQQLHPFSVLAGLKKSE